MSSENALPALPLCECPLPNDYFARVEGFVERLVAAMTPRQGEFLWALLAMYLTVLLVRRADSLVERWIDCRYPLPPPPQPPAPKAPE
ncbi:hypothetical protein N7453_012216 [Penicillium expansum]|nr:hypothetical protein N7453_012216 [Penicillium expansum]